MCPSNPVASVLLIMFVKHMEYSSLIMDETVLLSAQWLCIGLSSHVTLHSGPHAHVNALLLLFAAQWLTYGL